MSDALLQILAMIRAELPNMDERAAARVEIRIRQQIGGGKIYIPAAPKRMAQLRLAAAGRAPSNAKELERALQVSARHARRMWTFLG